jgi:hypothetical protein
MLALHNAGQFSCDYVGNTEMAKHYGRLRMFLLRRAGDGKGPPVLGHTEREATDLDDFERLAGPRNLRGTRRPGQAADMPPSTSKTVPEM